MPDLNLTNNSQPDHGRAMDQLLEALLEEQADTPPWIRPVPRSQDPGDGHRQPEMAEGQEDGQEPPRKRVKISEDEAKADRARAAANNGLTCCLPCINSVPHARCRQLVIPFLSSSQPKAEPSGPASGEPKH